MYDFYTKVHEQGRSCLIRDEHRLSYLRYKARWACDSYKNEQMNFDTIDRTELPILQSQRNHTTSIQWFTSIAKLAQSWSKLTYTSLNKALRSDPAHPFWNRNGLTVPVFKNVSSYIHSYNVEQITFSRFIHYCYSVILLNIIFLKSLFVFDDRVFD